jgi:hypothetical protein
MVEGETKNHGVFLSFGFYRILLAERLRVSKSLPFYSLVLSRCHSIHVNTVMKPNPFPYSLEGNYPP